jgi:hypothetical protein
MRSEAQADGVVGRGRRTLSRWLRPSLDDGAPTGVLTATELAALRTFTATLVGDELGDSDWTPVRDELARAAIERRGFAAVCARACRLLDRLGDGPFADAPPDVRAARVAAARLTVRPVARHELLAPGGRTRHEVRELLVPELLRVYFDSPAGWAVVGYDATLGGCRDAFAYTRRPA